MKHSRLFLLFISLSLELSLTAKASTATWSTGNTWDTATWNGGSDAYPGATGTSDIAVFNTAASLSGGLGTAIIPIGNLTESLSTTGTVSISDASNALEFAPLSGTNAINFTGSAPSQTLTLNLTSTFAGTSAMSVTLIAGSVLNFGSTESGRKLYLPDAALTFSGAGTVNIANDVTVTGVPGASSTASAVALAGGATMNFDGAAFSGKFTSNAIQVATSCTLNLQSNPNTKIVMSGASGTASIYITGTGFSQAGVLQVAGASGATVNTVIIGANIATGGTATYTGISTLDNSAAGNETVVFSSAPNNTEIIGGNGFGGSSGTSLLLQVSGGGIVDLNGATAYTYTTSSAVNGTEVKATGGDTILQLDDTAGVSLTGNTTVDTGCTIQLVGSSFDQMTSGTLTLNGAGGAAGTTGALENKNGSNTLGATIALASASTISSDTGTLTLTGGINDGTSLLTVAGTGNTIVSGTGISGSGGVTVATSGAGTVTLSAVNGYTGPTTVSAGTLIVSGSLTGSTVVSATTGGILTLQTGSIDTAGAVTVASTSELTGNGIIGALNVLAGGIFAPGVVGASGSGGVVTVSAASTFATGAAFSLQISGTGAGQYGQLAAGGQTVTLSGTTQLSLTLATTGYTPAVGDTFTLINNPGSAVAADFKFGSTVLAQGSTFSFGGDTWQISYDGNLGNDPGVSDDVDLEIIAVPEPATWATMLGGVAMLGFYQRLRKRRA